LQQTDVGLRQPGDVVVVRDHACSELGGYLRDWKLNKYAGFVH
jgi:hypothetical protein